MTINYSALLYDPVYATLGVPATFNAVSLTVIDDTNPVSLATSGGGFDARSVAEVRSVGPGAYARVSELTAKGVAREAYMDALLTFNGRSWTVRSYELQGSPHGEDMGEVRFLLKANDG